MKNSKEIAETVFRIRDEYLECQRKRNRRIKIAASFGSAVCMFAIVMVSVNRYSNSNWKLPYATNSTTDTTTEINPDTASQQVNDNIEASASTETELSANTATDAVTEKADDNSETDIVEESSLSDSDSDNSVYDNTDNEDKQTTLTPPPTNPVDTASPTDSELFPELKWDERTISMQFPEFTLNGITYGLRDAEITSEQINSKITDISLTGYDVYTDTNHSITADVFQVSHISDNCALAVQFRGYQSYYVYVNRNYSPQTLGELIDSLDIENNISFGNMYLNDGTSIDFYDQEPIEFFLSECRNALCINDDSPHTTLLNFSVNVGLLGIYNKSLAVTDDGYLITNIIEQKYTFYIGDDKTNELAERFGINDIVVTTTATTLFSQEDFYEE